MTNGRSQWPNGRASGRGTVTRPRAVYGEHAQPGAPVSRCSAGGVEAGARKYRRSGPPAVDDRRGGSRRMAGAGARCEGSRRVHRARRRPTPPSALEGLHPRICIGRACARQAPQRSRSRPRLHREVDIALARMDRPAASPTLNSWSAAVRWVERRHPDVGRQDHRIRRPRRSAAVGALGRGAHVPERPAGPDPRRRRPAMRSTRSPSTSSRNMKRTYRTTQASVRRGAQTLGAREQTLPLPPRRRAQHRRDRRDHRVHRVTAFRWLEKAKTAGQVDARAVARGCSRHAGSSTAAPWLSQPDPSVSSATRRPARQRRG